MNESPSGGDADETDGDGEVDRLDPWTGVGSSSSPSTGEYPGGVNGRGLA